MPMNKIPKTNTSDKCMFNKPFIGIMIVVSLFFIQCTNNNSGPDKFYTSFTKAQTAAGQKAQLMMVDFYADWCAPCKKLDREVFSSAEFKSLQDEFVFVKINAEEGKGIELSRKYDVNGFPNVVFMDSKGDEIERIMSYRPKGEYLEEIKRILAGERTVPKVEKQFDTSQTVTDAIFLS